MIETGWKTSVKYNGEKSFPSYEKTFHRSSWIILLGNRDWWVLKDEPTHVSKIGQ